MTERSEGRRQALPSTEVTSLGTDESSCDEDGTCGPFESQLALQTSSAALHWRLDFGGWWCWGGWNDASIAVVSSAYNHISTTTTSGASLVPEELVSTAYGKLTSGRLMRMNQGVAKSLLPLGVHEGQRCLLMCLLDKGLPNLVTDGATSLSSLSLSLSFSLFLSLSLIIYLPTYLPAYLPTHPPTYLPTYPPTHLPTLLPYLVFQILFIANCQRLPEGNHYCFSIFV